jgi:hypothetical protein
LGALIQLKGFRVQVSGKAITKGVPGSGFGVPEKTMTATRVGAIKRIVPLFRKHWL